MTNSNSLEVVVELDDPCRSYFAGQIVLGKIILQNGSKGVKGKIPHSAL